MELSARQQELVQAAIEIIARKGYEKLTTKNLASQIGISESALYRHIGSKHELVEMVLCHFEKLSCAVLEQIRHEQLAPLDCVRRFVLSRYELFSDNPDLARVMFSEELYKNDLSFITQYQSIMHIHRDEVVGYLLKAQKNGSIDQSLNPIQIFRIIVGSMRLIVSQWSTSDGAFDLISEGTSLLNTIIKLIEVKQ